MTFPNPVTGDGLLAQWLRRLENACRADRILPGLGYRVKRTTLGTFLEIKPGGGGIGVSTFRFKSDASDHVVCRAVSFASDGTATEQATDTNVAKPDKLRRSLSSATIPGIGAVSYTYSSGPDANNFYRLATGGSGSATHIVVPYWLVNDLIFAVPANTGVVVGGSQVGLIMIAPFRAWAQKK